MTAGAGARAASTVRRRRADGADGRQPERRRRARCWAWSGPTAPGKTTLLRAALGLRPLAPARRAWPAGRWRRLSERERARLAAYLPQERRVAWSMPAWRIAALGAAGRPPARGPRDGATRRLAEVGMAALAERGVLDMSGGERARVLLARLLATGAPLLVADEPAAGLDPDAQL